MPSSVSASPSIRRRATSAAMALITLVNVGTFFGIRAQSNNNVRTFQVSTQDGRSRLFMTGSGMLTGSGNVKIGDQRTGSGKLRLGGSDGSGICGLLADASCACIDLAAGAIAGRVAPASECDQ